jgi:hypothetical protein
MRPDGLAVGPWPLRRHRSVVMEFQMVCAGHGMASCVEAVGYTVFHQQYFDIQFICSHCSTRGNPLPVWHKLVACAVENAAREHALQAPRSAFDEKVDPRYWPQFVRFSDMFLAGKSSDEEQNGVAGLPLALDRGWPKATADVEPITAAKVAGQLAAPFPATADGELFEAARNFCSLRPSPVSS